jgi:hypothetical protein
LVCIFEDLVREPSRELARIQSFLDVSVQELELHRRNAAKPEFRETPIVPEDMARLVRLVAPARLFVEERLGRTIPEWHANE